ncbi:MAG TPA: glycosyltransferase family 2 protein [Deltaproteobacteria bacterium]|nr:glycosyltransferase family 2 protein [Deltaproteobacteria bacterium]
MMAFLLGLALLAIGGPFIVYPILLFLNARFFPRPLLMEGHPSDLPHVSLIICAHDEADSVAARLENALDLDYPEDRLEILLASDGSGDATVPIARAFEDRGVRVLDLPRQGKARALEAAVEASTGGILAFSDANSHWPATALRALVQPFRDPRVGGVAGDQRYRSSTANGEAAGERSYWQFDRMLKRWQSVAGNVISSTGAIHAVRRELFEAPPEDATDDFMISTGVIAQGRRLVFQEDAVAIEPPAAGHAGEFRRKVRIITRGLRALGYRRRLLDPTRHGLYAIELFVHKLWRRLTWIPFFGLCLASPFLIRAGGIPALFGFVTIGLVASGLLGLGSSAARRFKPISILAYVLMVNAACAVAFSNALRGRQVSRWEPDRGIGHSPDRVS